MSDTILTDKTLESESQEDKNKNENEKLGSRKEENEKVGSRKEENEKVECRKEENENEDDYENGDDYENEDEDDDKTMDQNKKKQKNKRFKWYFRWNNWQIKIIWRANKIDLKGYWPYNDYGDKELKFKYFKLELAYMSNEIDEKLFEELFGHTLIKLADKLINTTNKQENQVII